jgi:glycosyltransferase involved in cell wall biosynthesis
MTETIYPQSATVVITTRNRKQDLRRAIVSSLDQTFAVEVLIIDDGSIDGTAEMVRAEFPSVRLECNQHSLGLVVRRNQAALLAQGEIIFSIDDDAEFSQPDIVARVLKEFSESRIAAVAIPLINVSAGNVIRQKAPDAEHVWITNEFIGTAHAIRKAVFLRVGGYCDALVHQGEEGDLCIRLLERGYVVRVGSSAPVYHHESSRRNQQRMNVYGQRNLILFAWQNVPLPELILHLPATILLGLFWGLRNRHLVFRIRGTLDGLVAIYGRQFSRAPVSRSTYKLYRWLKKRGPRALRSENNSLNPNNLES